MKSYPSIDVQVYAFDKLDGSNMTATLFDVASYKKGILPPNEFIKIFGDLDIPQVLYRGRIGPEFIEKVRSSTLDGMTFEGVVCKGPFDKKLGGPIMFKVKTSSGITAEETRSSFRDYVN